MARQTISFEFDFNEEQEKAIRSILKKLNGDYNYTYSDVLDYIMHHSVYYEFTDEDRGHYEDLIDPIYNGIIQFEDDLMVFE